MTVTPESLAALAAHGCLTGDCPHEKQSECDKALADEVRELFGRAVIGVCKMNTVTIESLKARCIALTAGHAWGISLPIAQVEALLACTQWAAHQDCYCDTLGGAKCRPCELRDQLEAAGVKL